MVVNNTSISAGVAMPTLGVYASSKAAAASLTDVMRQELSPFGIRVVELRTGAVKSNVFVNQANSGLDVKLPASSLYNVAKGPVECALRGEFSSNGAQDATLWATAVVGDLLKNNSTREIWRGGSAYMMWIASFLPAWMFDGMFARMSGMDVVANAVAVERSRDRGKEN